MTSHPNYHLPANYEERSQEPLYFDDLDVEERHMVCQPDVYRMAGSLASALGARRIIDIGCGRASKGLQLAALRYSYTGIDFGANLAYCRENFPRHTWFEQDFEKDASWLLDELGDTSDAIIVCADVIEHLVHPESLLALLLALSRKSLAVLISTPERELTRGTAHMGPPPHPYHVREWAVAEFRALLEEHGFPLAWMGLTRSNSVYDEMATILAIAAVPRQENDRDVAWLCAGGLFNMRLGMARAGGAALQPARTGRVAVVSDHIQGFVRNGCGTAQASLAFMLAANGHDVVVIYTGAEPEDPGETERIRTFYASRGVKLECLPDPGPSPQFNYLTRAWLAARHLMEIDRDQPFDIIHFPECSGPGYYCLHAKALGLAFATTTLVVTPHGSLRWCFQGMHQPIKRGVEFLIDHIESESLRLADTVIGPSNYMLNWCARAGWSLPPDRTVVQQYLIPPAASATEGECAAHPPQRPEEIVFFGRHEIRKGLVLFLDALEKVRDTLPASTRITFLGEANYIHQEKSCDYITRRMHGLPWKYEILTGHDQASALRYLKQPGRIALIASFMDNLPNTVIECMTSGIPFIAARSGGIQELIHPEDLARCTFAFRPEDLAESLCKVLSEPPKTPRFAIAPEVTAACQREWHSWQCALQQSARQTGKASTAGYVPSSCVPVRSVGLVLLATGSLDEGNQAWQETLRGIKELDPEPDRIDILHYSAEPAASAFEDSGLHYHHIGKTQVGMGVSERFNAVLDILSKAVDWFHILPVGVRLHSGAMGSLLHILRQHPMHAASPAVDALPGCGASTLAPCFLPTGNEPLMNASGNQMLGGLLLSSALCTRMRLLPYTDPAQHPEAGDILRLIAANLHYHHYQVMPLVESIGSSGTPDDYTRSLTTVPDLKFIIPFAYKLNKLEAHLLMEHAYDPYSLQRKCAGMEAELRIISQSKQRLRRDHDKLKEKHKALRAERDHFKKALKSKKRDSFWKKLFGR